MVTDEKKREQLRAKHPDLYDFIMLLRAVFGPVVVRIKTK